METHRDNREWARRLTMLDKFLLFGATGDLAGRFLLPALAELQANKAFPETFQVVGTAPQRLSDEEFRLHAADRLAEFAKDVPKMARERLLGRLRYCPVELGVDDLTGALQALLGGSSDKADACRPIAAYLAVPPRCFPEEGTSGSLPPPVRRTISIFIRS